MTKTRTWIFRHFNQEVVYTIHSWSNKNNLIWSTIPYWYFFKWHALLKWQLDRNNHNHLPNFLIIEKLTAKHDNQSWPLKRDLKNFDENKLLIEIEKLNLQQETENMMSQMNQTFTFFQQDNMKVIDKSVPFNKLTKGKPKR